MKPSLQLTHKKLRRSKDAVTISELSSIKGKIDERRTMEVGDLGR